MVEQASHFHARGSRFGIEYVWIDWEQCNECDNLSKTILFRDFFRSLAS